MQSLFAQNKTLSDKVNLLERKVHKLEQDKLSNAIDIVGIPNVSNSNARELSQKLFLEALGTNIPDENIIDCFVRQARQKHNLEATDTAAENVNENPSHESTNTKPTSVCVRFSSSSIVKSIMTAKKTAHDKLNAVIFDDNCNNKIFINATLTGYFRALFSEARKIKVEKNISTYGMQIVVFT